MIPRTFPSTIDANGNRSMVIFPITTYDPSGRWRDWIPVRGGTNSAKVNTYDEDGGQSMTIIDTLTNKQAWLDYVPVVFVGGNDVDAWDVKDIGFIPGFGDVPSIVTNFSMLQFDRTGMTYSRAGDRSATVVDNEGYIWACKDNEMRMQGFRRVENFNPVSNRPPYQTVNSFSPQPLLNSQLNIDGSGTAWALAPGTTGFCQTNITIPADRYRYMMSYLVRPLQAGSRVYFVANGINTVEITSANFTSYYDFDTNTFGAGMGAATAEILEKGWVRISRIFTNNGSGTLFLLRIDSSALVNGRVAFGGIQVERCAPGQTLPSEYVSNGVLTTPFHGFFADGVKYFTTDRNGDDIPEATRLGVLIEEASTNLLVRSEEFGTTWATGGTAVVTSNNHISPAGIQNADTYVPNSGVAGILQQTVTPAVAAHTFSCYIKRTGTTLNSIRLQATEGANFAFADFNLSTGAIATGSSGMTSVSGSISDADSNGWRRCAITFTTITAAATNFLFTLPTASGNAVDGFYLWGAQLEQKAFITSYITTTSAAVTRNLDSLETTPVPSFSTLAGTLFIDWQSTGGTTTRVPMLINRLDGALSDFLDIVEAPGGLSNEVGGRVRANSSTDASITKIQASTRRKAALAYAPNDAAFSVSGQAVGTDATVGTPTMATSRIQYGRNFSSGFMLNNTIREVRYYPVRLSNDVLQAITA